MAAGGMKSLAGQTAIYGVGSIAGRFLNWMLVPLYTRVLPATGDFGVVTNLYGWTALFMALLTYGMETGLFRFINKKEEKEPLKVYSSVLYSVGFTSLAFIACILIFVKPLSAMLGYASHPEFPGMMACIVAVDAFCCIPFAYLRYKNRAVHFTTLKMISILSGILLNIFFLVICPKLDFELIRRFYVPEYGVGYIFISNAATSLLTLLMLIPNMLPALRIKPDRQRLKAILRYSFPFLTLGIAGVLNQSADKILFPFLYEDREYAQAQLGIYGGCFKIAVVMVMFIQAFRYAYDPFIFSRNRDGDSKTVYSDAMKYFIIFSLMIFLGVMLYFDIVKHFVDSKYYPGLFVVPVIMLGEMFFGIYFNLSVWYKLTDRARWGTYFSVSGCIVSVAIIVLFVPKYGFIACAFASLTSNFLMMLASYLVGQRYFYVKYDLKSAFVYSLLAMLCYFAGILPHIDSDILSILYRTVILLVFAGIAIKKEAVFKGRFPSRRLYK
jgi:O-antigen/teichoic acid export membrane protein